MIVQTADITPETKLTPQEQHQIYCGLDNCVTKEVREELEPIFQDHPHSQTIYSFERGLQGAYLDIMTRGFAVDQPSRSAAITNLTQRINHLQKILHSLSFTLCDKSLNPRSSDQLKHLFYDTMKLPQKWISQKGVRKLSMNREVLENLFDHYLYARPFIALVLSIRDLSKQLEFFETEIDFDGRFRTSYNIAGTESGRPSSSENAFGTGGNAQNIAPYLRYVLVADPGKKIGNIDFEQVEARDVGFFEGCLFRDWTFLDACESGDLHTTNAKRIWRELEWSGNPALDRAIADSVFYRGFSYRDMSKRGGHLTNYKGTAWTASRHLKVPIKIMEDFQARYCLGGRLSTGEEVEPAYPAHCLYWQWCAQQLQTVGFSKTPFGRVRHFFGRPEDDTTLREFIANLPQSTTADRTNLCLWRAWKYHPKIELLAQTYDSITFQYSESDDENAIIEQALDLMKIELRSPDGRSYIVPAEAKVGWNWGNLVTERDVEKATREGQRVPRLNPGGLSKWNPHKRDERTRPHSFLIQS